MQLGAEAISIEIGGEAFELRPSLRAGMNLTRRHGLPALTAAVRDFNITVIADILKSAGVSPAALLHEIGKHGIGTVRIALTKPLALFVLAIAGIDPDNDAKPTRSTGTPMSPDEYHARLFGIATGWLGWTPDQAWNATPAEIIAAKAGRTDLITDVLKAIFGTKDDETPKPYSPEKLAEIEASGIDPEFDREGLRALKAKLARAA